MATVIKDKPPFSFPLPDYHHTDQNSIRNELIIQIIKISYKIMRLTNDVNQYDEREFCSIDSSYRIIISQSLLADDNVGCNEGIDEVNKYLASCLILLHADDKQLSPVEVFLAYARRALHLCIRDLNEGGLIEMLTSLSATNYWLGLAEGCHKTEKTTDKKKKAAAKHAADIRHMPSRSLKNDAIQYYIAHRNDFKNKDDAAFYISNNVVKSTFSTVRDQLKGI